MMQRIIFSLVKLLYSSNFSSFSHLDLEKKLQKFREFF